MAWKNSCANSMRIMLIIGSLAIITGIVLQLIIDFKLTSFLFWVLAVYFM